MDSVSELLKGYLTPAGMALIVGWVSSKLIEMWPWFGEQSSTIKWVIVTAICAVIGCAIGYALYGSGLTEDQIIKIIVIIVGSNQLTHNSDKDAAKADAVKAAA